jgi:hypothetical protein
MKNVSMKKRFSIASRVVVGLCTALCFALAIYAHAQSQGTSSTPKGAVMNHATGTFDVKMAPQKPDNPIEEAASIARMTIDKQWHGDLEATSKGEMLATPPDAKGSGIYVALERVTGTLKGRSGSFLLHHTGIMNRGVPELSISVVPDSGTGQLTGITGKVMINIGPDKKHSYDFEYMLPDAQ